MSRYPSAEQLMADAVAATGLDDFGPGDFVEGLEVLLDSLAVDAGLSPVTDDAVVGVLRRRLENRLLVERWYVDHPEVDDVAIEGPVRVIGLPRTSTTALGSMLSLDPQLRSACGSSATRCRRRWRPTRRPTPAVAAGTRPEPGSAAGAASTGDRRARADHRVAHPRAASGRSARLGPWPHRSGWIVTRCSTLRSRSCGPPAASTR